MKKIYLAGKVAKGEEIGKIADWREQYKELISKYNRETFEFLDPEGPDLDESDSVEIVGHDCDMIRQCDIVIVNAEKKLGVGTAQEMIVAKYFNKYVISIIPDNSHYCRFNLNMYGSIIPKWIHPFMKVMSDKVYSEISEMMTSFDEVVDDINKGSVKGISIIDQACDYYLKKHNIN